MYESVLGDAMAIVEYDAITTVRHKRDIGLFIFIDDYDDLERMLVEDELDEEDFEWLTALRKTHVLKRNSKEILSELPGMTEL